ncbi:MAG: hypothetical protein ABSE35_10240 [Bryobacteraceae bacterium]
MGEQNSPQKAKHTWLEIAAVVIAVLAFLAAAWQGYISNDTEKRQLRAYVGVQQGGYMGLEDSGPIGVGYNFINHGQTPAQKFNLIGAVDLLPYPLPQGYVLADASARPPQDGVIFPNETPPMTGWIWERDKVDAPTKKEIISANPRREIYAHGVATYDDIFGSHWRTEFCFFLNPRSFVRDADGNILRDKDGHMQFQWAPCFGYNKVY